MSTLVKESWALWIHQGKALALREVGRNLAGRKAIPLLLVASLPLVLAVLRALFFPESKVGNTGTTVTGFAIIFQVVFLRLILFFSCAAMFVRVFRGEILERSLHFVFLAPIRRPVLVIGKYLGALLTALAVFLPTIVMTYIVYFLPHGFDHMTRFFTSNGGFGQFATYVFVVGLACTCYGAVFMLAGLFFKNPMVPAIMLLLWEMMVPFMPPVLKAFSLIYYLTSLAPVPVSQGAFSFIAAPVPNWLAVFALMAITAGLLVVAAFKAQHMEISYASE